MKQIIPRRTVNQNFLIFFHLLSLLLKSKQILVDKPIINLTVDTSCSSTLTLPTNITEYDVCTYSEKVANCVPDKIFNFPQKNNRSFRLDWLNTYSWLAYYPGAFCLPCVLFGSKFLTHWPNAKYLFNKHQNAEAGLHIDSMCLLIVYLFHSFHSCYH